MDRKPVDRKPVDGKPVDIKPDGRKTCGYKVDKQKADNITESYIGKEAYMEKHRIFKTTFASVYPCYTAKAERKGRTKEEVDEIICWLTGYSREGLKTALEKEIDFETFFAEAPALNPARLLIKGVVCGVRVEEVEDPLMREIRYLDKLVDELAKGKKMEKILRQG